MSIAYFPFAPTISGTFSFTPTFAGTQYVVITAWNPFRGGWVVEVYTLTGTLVVAKPLRTSPDDYNINLIAGYIEGATLVYRASSDTFEVGP